MSMRLDDHAVAALSRKSIDYRQAILDFIVEAKAGHTGGSLSVVEILNVLYNVIMNISPENWESPDRDRYIQSKGHSVEALYVVLADKGFISEDALHTGGRFGSHMIGHPTRKVRGVEHNTGGLGHGLGVSVGLALAARLGGRRSRVYCLLGDGELAEGSNWEAAMCAAHYRLDNLVAIVDRNHLQIAGCTEDVIRLEPLAEKWKAFGWTVREVPGHDLRRLAVTIGGEPEGSRPTVVIADTVKGKGISFIEGQAGWHHHVPTPEEYAQAMAELESQREQIDGQFPPPVDGKAGRHD